MTETHIPSCEPFANYNSALDLSALTGVKVVDTTKGAPKIEVDPRESLQEVL